MAIFTIWFFFTEDYQENSVGFKEKLQELKSGVW